jgi:hypothetical protein
MILNSTRIRHTIGSLQPRDLLAGAGNIFERGGGEAWDIAGFTRLARNVYIHQNSLIHSVYN